VTESGAVTDLLAKASTRVGIDMRP
jgi:hypothetical protein